MIDNEEIRGEDCYRVKTGYNGTLHWETYDIFYINKRDCNKIYINEVISGDVITLEEWRKKNNVKAKEEFFSELFNEGSNIDFTPNDLKDNKSNIKEFKQKLDLFENQQPTSHDFDIDDLSLLVNNEVFTNNEKYIDSSWLTYFIKKYKFEFNKIFVLMKLAISQEDYNAVKIILDNSSYIVSLKDLEDAKQKIKYVESLHGKIDLDEYYDPSRSKIKEISELLKRSFDLNKIKDNDGFTNLRKAKSSSSEILQKIKTGEKIEVLDNNGDWYLVRTNEGNMGYVHKSKIVSE